MRIQIDGIIYSSQQHGGITRAFDNLLAHVAEVPGMQPRLHLASGVVPGRLQGVVDCVPIPPSSDLRPGRLFRKCNAWRRRRSVEQYWSRQRDGVFLSTYYSTYPSLRIPQLLVVHDMIFEDHPHLFPPARRQRHISEKHRAIAAASAIACPSEHARLRLLHHCGNVVPESNVHVIPWGLDETLCGDDLPAKKSPAEAGLPAAAYILHVGSRYPHKNTLRLLQMFGTWPRRNEIHLLSIGGGQWSPAERHVIEQAGMADCVHALPAAPRQVLQAAYQNACAVVVPSLDEGFGLPLLEAMALGRPAAASQTGSLPEVGGDLVHYFDPGSIDQMRAAVDRAVDEGLAGEPLPSLVRRARSFRWRDCAEGYAGLLHDLASRRGQAVSVAC